MYSPTFSNNFFFCFLFFVFCFYLATEKSLDVESTTLSVVSLFAFTFTPFFFDREKNLLHFAHFFFFFKGDQA